MLGKKLIQIVYVMALYTEYVISAGLHWLISLACLVHNYEGL